MAHAWRLLRQSNPGVVIPLIRSRSNEVLLNWLSLRQVPPCHLRSRLTFVTYQLYSYLSIFPWWRQATECENERRRGMLSTVAG